MNRTRLVSASLFIVASVIVICKAHPEDEAKPMVSVNREEIEKQALAAYKNTCYRIQELADWMAIVLKIKGFWTKSLSRRKQARLSEFKTEALLLDESISDSSVPEELKRSKRNAEDLQSCASLKSLHASAQTYVHLQTELMKLKAILGGNMLKSGTLRLNDSFDALKIFRDRIYHLDIINRTSSELLTSLKQASSGLALQLQEERAKTTRLIKEIGQSNDFLQSLNSMKGGILSRLQNLVDSNEGLKKAQAFLVKGDLLQALSGVLDKNTRTGLSAQETQYPEAEETSTLIP